jgi:hypothetical protein
MRLLSTIITLFLSLTNLYGQIEIELYFKNTCDNSISKLEFELLNLNVAKDNLQSDIRSEKGVAIVPAAGIYYLTSNFVWGDNMVGMFDQIINIKDSPKQVDTLDVPAIKFTWDGVLHSKYWNYFKCDKLCDGLESDLYPNGKKRIEGEFKNGKPIHLTEYRNDETKESEFWYRLGTNQYERVNYFNESGMLETYELYQSSKRKTTKTTFIANGHRVAREVTKHSIEK